jgi:hypothetical protein
MRFWSERLPYLAEFARTRCVLHMGPGREGSFGVRVDNLPEVRPDVLMDLNRAPYPFKDNSFDAAYALSVIENKASSFYERHLCFLVRGRGLYLEPEAIQ